MAIEDGLDGRYSPAPRVIDPTLTLLEETGLVSAEAQGAKTLYSLTEEDRAFLDKEAGAIAAAARSVERS